MDAVTQLFWMRAGERGSVVHVVQLLVTTVINFSTGMLLTMFLFTCRLPGYVASFGPPLVCVALERNTLQTSQTHHAKSH